MTHRIRYNRQMTRLVPERIKYISIAPNSKYLVRFENPGNARHVGDIYWCPGTLYKDVKDKLGGRTDLPAVVVRIPEIRTMIKPVLYAFFGADRGSYVGIQKSRDGKRWTSIWKESTKNEDKYFEVKIEVDPTCEFYRFYFLNTNPKPCHGQSIPCYATLGDRIFLSYVDPHTVSTDYFDIELINLQTGVRRPRGWLDLRKVIDGNIKTKFGFAGEGYAKGYPLLDQLYIKLKTNREFNFYKFGFIATVKYKFSELVNLYLDVMVDYGVPQFMKSVHFVPRAGKDKELIIDSRKFVYTYPAEDKEFRIILWVLGSEQLIRPEYVEYAVHEITFPNLSDDVMWFISRTSPLPIQSTEAYLFNYYSKRLLLSSARR